MADWIEEAKAARQAQVESEAKKHADKVGKHYVAAVSALRTGKGKVCIPHEFAQEVAQALTMDGCKMLHIGFGSGNDVYKVDF